jgi:hypothetical protein
MAKMPPDLAIELYKMSPALLELLKRATRPGDLPATHTIEGEPLKPLLAHVGPDGNFNEPVEKPISPQIEVGATAVARIEGGKITAITVVGSGTWNEPYVLSIKESDIPAITRAVARGG